MKQFNPKNFSRIVKWVIKEGHPQPTERGDTIEIMNASFMLHDPRNRIVTESWRKTNFPFGVAEWLGLMTGSDDLRLFTNFVSSYSKYSTDGKSVDGAYGPRLAIGPTGKVEDDGASATVKHVVDMLRTSGISRRAVIPIYNVVDLYGGGGKNTPCTLSLQFMIRDSKLICITNMRSNDVILGLTYDMFSFTMLQEYIARQLGVELGPYYHNAGSFHVYVDAIKGKKFEAAERWAPLMNPMPVLTKYDIWGLYNIYVQIKDSSFPFDFEVKKLCPYMQDLAFAAEAFVCRKNPLAAWIYFKKIQDYTIRHVTRPWLTGERDD